MKPNKLFATTVLGLSLATTSAFACEHGSSSSGESHWSFLGWCHNIIADSHRECDPDGQDSGRGNNCDHGRGNGGGYCGTGSSTGGGSTSGGGTSTGGGSTVGPKG